MDTNEHKITMYTSNVCPHAWIVKQFMNDYEIPVDLINIDQIDGARQELIQLNGGYASVPTLIFPDGEKMVEPSLRQLRAKMGIEETSLLDRIISRFTPK